MHSVSKPKRLHGVNAARFKNGIREVEPTPVDENSEKPELISSFKRQTTKLKDISLKFLRMTSLHALKFIADSEITNGEKYFFFVAFLTAVAISCYYITAIYFKWMDSPIITTTSSMSSSISTIPFPAITICNLNQARKSAVQGFKKYDLNYWRLQSLCKPNITGVPPEILEKSGKGTDYRDFVLNVSETCANMMISCKFGSEIIECKSLFQDVLTDEGQCCTFNAVERHLMFFRGSDEITLSNWTTNGKPIDWSPEKGYDDNVPKNSFPRPALGTGVHMGLSVVLNASLSEYYCSSGSSSGFKMIMHSPVETPKVANYGYLLSAGMESRIAIVPEVQKADSSIRSMHIAYRNCLFSSESKLKFFRTYTKSNCELECELQRNLAICGCVPNYLPRITNSMKICGLKNLNCTKHIQAATDSLMSLDVECAKCLPGCTQVSYIPIITTNPLILGSSHLRDRVNVEGDIDIEHLAVAHFYYEQNTFRAKTKEELLNFTDFLANSGGILGLFMGFSVLAVIEFLYFVFLAPYCAIKKLLFCKRNKNPLKGHQIITGKENTLRPSYYQSHFKYSDNNIDYSFARKIYKPRNPYPYFD